MKAAAKNNVVLTGDHDLFKQHLTRFIDISADELLAIRGYFTEVSFARKKSIIREGDWVHATYWVRKGLLISGFTDNEGKDHVIQFANEGCWITDQQAFYNREKAIFTITCLEDCELLAITYENREKLCTAVPQMERFFRKKANDSFVKQQKRLLTYMTADASMRYHLLLDEYPGLLQRISKKVLAAYLGVSRETLSRLKSPKKK